MAKPTVTYALMCYRHEDYVERAVQSALRQQGEALDIVISDDASDDRTIERIEKAVAGYTGPHRVRLNRNPENLGMGHFNRLLELAEGDYIVIAHGDDYSHTERTVKLMEIFARERVSMVSSNCRVMNRDGKSMGHITDRPSHRMKLEDLIELGWQETMLGSTHAIHRDVLARFGGVDPQSLPISYDLAFPFRGALLDGTYFCEAQLVAWRRHGRNATDRIVRSSKAKDEQFEAVMGIYVTEMVGMLNDVRRLIRHDGARKGLEEVRDRLSVAIQKATEIWVVKRNSLLASGLLPGWVPQEEFEIDSAESDYTGEEVSWLFRQIRNRVR
jgi:glycosyltransferase involved in cell wall biosynthesis